MTKQCSGSAFCAPFARPSHSFDKPLRSLSERSRRGFRQLCRVVAFVATLVLTCAVGASAQAPTLLPEWNQLSPATSPSLRFRNSHGIRLGAQSQVVMFSGLECTICTTRGSGMGPTGPRRALPTARLARSNLEMAYDPVHGQVVMFGGRRFHASPRSMKRGCGTGPTGCSSLPRTLQPGAPALLWSTTQRPAMS